MKAVLLLGLCVLSLGVPGCARSGPDQERYIDGFFWTDAQVIGEPSPAELAVVRPGDATVLTCSEGWTRGRWSTAHASHDTLFLTLPGEVRAGETYEVSREAGTLVYDSFTGYGFRCADPDFPARGTVRVESVSRTSILAEVKVGLTALRADGGEHAAEASRRTYLIDRVLRFERARKYDQPLPASERLSGAAPI